jgi:hypothetical protein
MPHSRQIATLITLLFLSACENVIVRDRAPLPQTPDYATAPLDLSTPKAVAHSMMIAMYRGDTDMIDQIFIEGATLNRLSADATIRHNGLAPWREWVATLEVGQAHETLFDIKVEQFNTLATVWAPFVIDVNGKRVGCGVNQFTMAKQNEDWRIVSGIDVQAPKEDCETFRQTYQSSR